jgi:hypothetical protein
MRENRSYGSEGGGPELNRVSLPLSTHSVLANRYCTSLQYGAARPKMAWASFACGIAVRCRSHVPNAGT